MNQVQVEQKSYQMPPQDGFTVAFFLTVADVERSVRFYETVFGGRILSRGDSNGLPGYIQIANVWLIVNVGGGPTPEKPSVTLSVPDPDKISSFMHIRVADIRACYELWRSRGAEFITDPKDTYGESSMLYPRSGWLHYRSCAKQAGLRLWLRARDTKHPRPICRPRPAGSRVCASARGARTPHSRA